MKFLISMDLHNLITNLIDLDSCAIRRNIADIMNLSDSPEVLFQVVFRVSVHSIGISSLFFNQRKTNLRAQTFPPRALLLSN